MFLLHFNIIQSGHNLHATLVLSTSLFFFTKPKCCHMLAFTFLFGTIFKRLAPIYHVCYTATALSANSRRGGSTKSLNCHFECGEEPADEFCKKKKNLGKFISASVHVKLFLNLRIIPDRPESTGEAFILSRKMLREII